VQICEVDALLITESFILFTLTSASSFRADFTLLTRDATASTIVVIRIGINFAAVEDIVVTITEMLYATVTAGEVQICKVDALLITENFILFTLTSASSFRADFSIITRDTTASTIVFVRAFNIDITAIVEIIVAVAIIVGTGMTSGELQYRDINALAITVSRALITDGLA
jgi:hypothetical protein